MRSARGNDNGRRDLHWKTLCRRRERRWTGPSVGPGPTFSGTNRPSVEFWSSWQRDR